MARGETYFAWVDADTPWSEDLRRYDENVFSFEISQSEGQFCQATVTLLNPKTGVLNTGAGRKLWAWIAHDCGAGGLFKMYGRLFGIPTSLVGELAIFIFRARPIGYEDEKRVLAETLKVLPYYSRSFVDPQREEDDVDIVLEAYTHNWHIDRETHQVTISSEVSGEDGGITLTRHIYDGLEMGIPTGPLAKVTVPARFNWTQKATGLGFNLGKWITKNYPHEEGVGAFPYRITSFTFGADSWPKAGSSLGNGWVVTYSQTTPLYDLTVRHHSEGGKLITQQGTSFLSQQATANWPGEDTTELTSSLSFDYIGAYPSYENSPPGAVLFNPIVTEDRTEVQYDDTANFGDALSNWSDSLGGTSRQVSNMDRTYAETRALVPRLDFACQLFIGFDARRPMTEAVRISLLADIQPVHTDPEDDMEMLLPDMQTVDLATVISDASAATLPIGNAGYRSYLMLEQGQDDLRYLLALCRAHLLKRARCVEITVQPYISVMPLVTLRKMMRVYDDRIPGGVAVGKITAYSLKLDGMAARLERSVTMQCCVGRAAGGLARSGPIAHDFAPGEPIYAVAEYMVDEYQEFYGMEVPLDPTYPGTPGFPGSPTIPAQPDSPAVPGTPPSAGDPYGTPGIPAYYGEPGQDSYPAEGNFVDGPDTGFVVPQFLPNDDGIDILAPDLDIEDLIEEGLTVIFPPAVQRLHLGGDAYAGSITIGGDPSNGQQAAAERSQSLQNTLNQIQTEMRFKLKSMEDSFVTEYTIDTKNLLIPMHIDLGG